jgi:beta-lactam-binding protein with PASTA domain
MPRLNVNLTPEQYKFLKDLKGMSISSWVRYVINEGINKALQEKYSASKSNRKVGEYDR